MSYDSTQTVTLTIKLTKNFVYHKKKKIVKIDSHFIGEEVEKKDMQWYM